jgi:hypothetical protein
MASAPTYKISAGKLVITIDVSDAALKGAQMSKTGKSRVVATSSGFMNVEGTGKPVKLSFNVITTGE